MKGLRDITNGPRSHKETIDDYVRLNLKRVVPSDEGTYCILLKNRYGCDRSFFSVKVNIKFAGIFFRTCPSVSELFFYASANYLGETTC